MSAKPATPLPWEQGWHGKRSYVSAPKIHNVIDLGAVREDDAAFIVHACNNYGRLVEALRYIARGYSGNVGNAEGHSGTHCAEHASNILRDLGEGE